MMIQGIQAFQAIFQPISCLFAWRLKRKAAFEVLKPDFTGIVWSVWCRGGCDR
jgi:hypothetical protein